MNACIRRIRAEKEVISDLRVTFTDAMALKFLRVSYQIFREKLDTNKTCFSLSLCGLVVDYHYKYLPNKTVFITDINFPQGFGPGGPGGGGAVESRNVELHNIIVTSLLDPRQHKYDELAVAALLTTLIDADEGGGSNPADVTDIIQALVADVDLPVDDCAVTTAIGALFAGLVECRSDGQPEDAAASWNIIRALVEDALDKVAQPLVPDVGFMEYASHFTASWSIIRALVEDSLDKVAQPLVPDVEDADLLVDRAALGITLIPLAHIGADTDDALIPIEYRSDGQPADLAARWNIIRALVEDALDKDKVAQPLVPDVEDADLLVYRAALGIALLPVAHFGADTDDALIPIEYRSDGQPTDLAAHWNIIRALVEDALDKVDVLDKVAQQPLVPDVDVADLANAIRITQKIESQGWNVHAPSMIKFLANRLLFSLSEETANPG